MKKLLKSSIALIFIFCISCNSNKKVVETNKEKTLGMTEKEFLTQGFKKGTLLTGTKNKTACSAVIQLENSVELLDPINLTEVMFKEASKTSNIWIKYNSLRMQNRCEKARPITIIEIKKRDE